MNVRTVAVAVFIVVIALISLIWLLPGVRGSAKAGAQGVTATSRPTDLEATPVLVELFTSEGCSSCPPADALLRRLGRTQPVRGANVIVLEEHVDYWDGLGWKDPFSSAAATARQSEYGEGFGGAQVYTPQMVVDGHAEFVGSSEGDAIRAIRTAGETHKPDVHLSWAQDGMLAIQVGQLSNAKHDDTPQVFLAVVENKLHSDVKRGENGGRTLEHDGVARQLIEVGKVDTGSAGFSSTVSVRTQNAWNRANLGVVVFVQENHSRRVLAASAIPFPQG